MKLVWGWGELVWGEWAMAALEGQYPMAMEGID